MICVTHNWTDMHSIRNRNYGSLNHCLCFIVSLNLCKEYLNTVTFKISYTPDKELNILIY